MRCHQMTVSWELNILSSYPKMHKTHSSNRMIPAYVHTLWTETCHFANQPWLLQIKMPHSPQKLSWSNSDWVLCTHRSSALPFIQRGCYSHVQGKKKGQPYTLLDICVVGSSSLSSFICLKVVFLNYNNLHRVRRPRKITSLWPP